MTSKDRERWRAQFQPPPGFRGDLSQGNFTQQEARFLDGLAFRNFTRPTPKRRTTRRQRKARRWADYNNMMARSMRTAKMFRQYPQGAKIDQVDAVQRT